MERTRSIALRLIAALGLGFVASEVALVGQSQFEMTPDVELPVALEALEDAREALLGARRSVDDALVQVDEALRVLNHLDSGRTTRFTGEVVTAQSGHSSVGWNNLVGPIASQFGRLTECLGLVGQQCQETLCRLDYTVMMFHTRGRIEEARRAEVALSVEVKAEPAVPVPPEPTPTEVEVVDSVSSDHQTLETSSSTPVTLFPEGTGYQLFKLDASTADVVAAGLTASAGPARIEDRSFDFVESSVVGPRDTSSTVFDSPHQTVVPGSREVDEQSSDPTGGAPVLENP